MQRQDVILTSLLSHDSRTKINNITTIMSTTTDPSQAQGAQIPLQSFTLPTFPPQASGLQALTLTSDIKLDEYQTELAAPYTIPALPPSIGSLTLELFSLGYPDTWLRTLASRLPNLKSLVAYSQLLGGLTAASQADAVDFFRALPGLRALHLLDVFAQRGFFEALAPHVKYDEGERRGLMFLEVNYTVQESDEAWLSRVQAGELASLIGPGLVTCAFNVAEAEVTDDLQDPGHLSEDERRARDGIVAVNKSLSEGLVEALVGEESRPRGLRVLNLSLFTLSMQQLKKILEMHKGLMVLIVTLEIEKTDTTKQDLIAVLEHCGKLEQVEIVVNPGLQFFIEASHACLDHASITDKTVQVNNARSDAMEKVFPSKSDMETLTKKCEKLNSFKANVLRSKSLPSLEWERKREVWTGGVTGNVGNPENEFHLPIE